MGLFRPFYPQIGDFGCAGPNSNRHGRAKIINSRILLDSVCSSKIVMGRLVKNYILKKMM